VQLVARNCECPKGVNNAPCVVCACIKNTVRTILWITHRGSSFVQQVARYEGVN